MLEKNVMIVDDNDLIGSVMKRHLDTFIREVAIAPTGEMAIETIQQGYFDVAILDINLPGMSGWEVLAKIRELSPETKVIIITACVTEDDRAIALRRGAFDLLPKPFYLRRLDQAIYRAVGGRQRKHDYVSL
ncbi:MAG: response regulator [Syntrophales bacterium]|nr:response regulator [Syntrophales bacterium]